MTKEEQILKYLDHLDNKTETILNQLEIANQYLYKLNHVQNDVLDEEEIEVDLPIGSTGIVDEEGGSTK